MNNPGKLSSAGPREQRRVFVSYASADGKQALRVCNGIEKRGNSCWISSRDVEPGQNYQEAIVRAIRRASAVVLIFSDAANSSDEIKKELSLASKHHVPLIALRLEDVEPSDAFAYELSTRQWIDAFGNWDRSIDRLVRSLGQLSSADMEQETRTRCRRVHPPLPQSLLPISLSALLVVAAGAAVWLLDRPSGAVAHNMQVRLTGFERLSADLPRGLPDAVRDEIIAAFATDGEIGVSTAAAPLQGNGPAYALGGTLRREGDSVRVAVQLTNEHSGATLWSDAFNYDGGALSKVPRDVAVDTGYVVRCGLFGASTYSKALPDAVMADYLQVCHNLVGENGPPKALEFARKIVAAAPDFSWGWSAVENADLHAIYWSDNPTDVHALRREGVQAADTAIRLDRSNSEAFAFKSLLIDEGDLVARESLLKRAISARPLACGCEHHIYGTFLMEVGRTNDAIAEFRRSIAVLALAPDSQMSLGKALVATNSLADGQQHLRAALDLLSDPAARDDLDLQTAVLSRQFASALKLIREQRTSGPPQYRSAIGAGLAALLSTDPDAKARAAEKVATISSPGDELTVDLLALLGAKNLALKQVLDAAAAHKFGARSWLFMPSMADVLRDPSFPAVAQHLGLFHYWRTTHTKPDVCSAKDEPSFCNMI